MVDVVVVMGAVEVVVLETVEVLGGLLVVLVVEVLREVVEVVVGTVVVDLVVLEELELCVDDSWSSVQ